MTPTADQNCSVCRYWHDRAAEWAREFISDGTRDVPMQMPVCRRFPPRAGGSASFPETTMFDVCGEFAPR